MSEIFRGDGSSALWMTIRTGPKRDAMYALACKCQELEEALDAERAERERLEERVAKLEKQIMMTNAFKEDTPPAPANPEQVYADCMAEGLSDAEARSTAWPDLPAQETAQPVYDPATCRAIAEYVRSKWPRVSAGEVLELAGEPLPVDRP